MSALTGAAIGVVPSGVLVAIVIGWPAATGIRNTSTPPGSTCPTTVHRPPSSRDSMTETMFVPEFGSVSNPALRRTDRLYRPSTPMYEPGTRT